MFDHILNMPIKDVLKNNSKKLVFGMVGIVVLAVALAPTYYFYTKYQETTQKLNNPTEAAKNETKQLVSRVGKLIALPLGEEPTIATVSDYDKLKGNPFFESSQNGDKLLIYPTAKKAFLYRPSTDIVVNVTTVNIGAGQDGQVAGATTGDVSGDISKLPKLAIYNGTTTVGLTQRVEDTLASAKVGVNVVSKENASRNDYGPTFVVDITGNNKDLVTLLAGMVGGQVSALPAGELNPEADVLIIAGTSLK